MSKSGAFLYDAGGFWRRLLAFVLDGSIVTLLQTPVGSLLFGLIGAIPGPGLPGWVRQGLGWGINILIAATYFGFFYSRRGASPGKALFGLRIIDERTGFYPSVGRALMRELVAKTFMVILTLGIAPIFIAFRSDRRGLHDFVSGSRVIRVRVELVR